MKKIVLKVTVEVPDDYILDMTMMLNVFNLFEK